MSRLGILFVEADKIFQNALIFDCNHDVFIFNI